MRPSVEYPSMMSTSPDATAWYFTAASERPDLPKLQPIRPGQPRQAIRSADEVGGEAGREAEAPRAQGR